MSTKSINLRLPDFKAGFLLFSFFVMSNSMARSSKQIVKASHIDSLAEQIFIRMSMTTHHGFDAAHYVRKSYEFAQAFYQNQDVVKTIIASGNDSEKQGLPEQ